MRKILGLVLLGCFLISSCEVVARDHNDARAAVKNGNALPLKRILPRVRKRVPGRVLDAQLKPGAKMRYELRVLGKKNVVRTVTVDAQSGKILRVK